MIGQPAIHQIAVKVIQFRPMGLIAPLARARSHVHKQLSIMVGSARQGGHDDQTQFLNQVLQHLTDVGELLVARQLDRMVDYGRLTWSLISHLTMEIGGRFQDGIAEGVRVVHAEQGHLPVGQ